MKFISLLNYLGAMVITTVIFGIMYVGVGRAIEQPLMICRNKLQAV